MYAESQLESFIFLSSAAVTIDPRYPRQDDRTPSELSDFVEFIRRQMGPQAATNPLYQSSKILAEWPN